MSVAREASPGFLILIGYAGPRRFWVDDDPEAPLTPRTPDSCEPSTTTTPSDERNPPLATRETPPQSHVPAPVEPRRLAFIRKTEGIPEPPPEPEQSSKAIASALAETRMNVERLRGRLPR